VTDARKTAGRGCPSRAGGVPDTAAVAERLLAWYRRARRDLPWRRSRDPYAVWVSEVMLQQTQVDRVAEYFPRFMDRFPTVRHLARAPEADVLRLWEGLGYYRRARQLHAAAKQVVAEHGAAVPRTVAELRGLPGIGRYTAAAILSIAFDVSEPIVEANSRRVIARLAGHAAPLDGPGGDEPIWSLALSLVPKHGAGRFNQALMDLGAMICTPDRPRCGDCPLERLCEARRTNSTAEIPARAARRAVTELRETAVVFRRAGRVLVVRRGPGEWWEGLWDFPRVPGSARAAATAIASSRIFTGLGCGKPFKVGGFVHSVTHHRIRLDVVVVLARRSGAAVRGRRWVAEAALAKLAMTSPGRKIARLVESAALSGPDATR
jgi:A/G-specific adenine glycosylase